MSVLTSCDSVTVTSRDLTFASQASETGLSIHGGPETAYVRDFALRWRIAHEGHRTLIRLHWDAYIRGGRQPFSWTLPGTARTYTVTYSGPPQFTRNGRRAGSATVNLSESPLTD